MNILLDKWEGLADPLLEIGLNSLIPGMAIALLTAVLIRSGRGNAKSRHDIGMLALALVLVAPFAIGKTETSQRMPSSAIVQGQPQEENLPRTASIHRRSSS